MQIRDLFIDKDKNKNTLSKGAVLLWLSFLCLVFFWVLYAIAVYEGRQPIDAPDSLESIFVFLLAYVVFPKAGEIFNKKEENKKIIS